MKLEKLKLQKELLINYYLFTKKYKGMRIITTKGSQYIINPNVDFVVDSKNFILKVEDESIPFADIQSVGILNK